MFSHIKQREIGKQITLDYSTYVTKLEKFKECKGHAGENFLGPLKTIMFFVILTACDSCRHHVTFYT